MTWQSEQHEVLVSTDRAKSFEANPQDGASSVSSLADNIASGIEGQGALSPAASVAPCCLMAASVGLLLVWLLLDRGYESDRRVSARVLTNITDSAMPDDGTVVRPTMPSKASVEIIAEATILDGDKPEPHLRSAKITNPARPELPISPPQKGRELLPIVETSGTPASVVTETKTVDPASSAEVEIGLTVTAPAEERMSAGNALSKIIPQAEAIPAKPDTSLIPPVTTSHAMAVETRAVSTTGEAQQLLSRADTLLAAGDFASARLFYERAAAAGNGLAALRIGLSFDPAFLTRARMSQVAGDTRRAEQWYRRARDLGNTEAEILLKGLAPATK